MTGALQPFGDRLAEQVGRKGSALVVGFDPHLAWMPPSLAEPLAQACRMAEGDQAALHAAAQAVARWGSELVQTCAPYSVGVKLQMAFFEQFGAAGWDAACQVARAARASGLLVIADAKRGDIASTMTAYGHALFGPVSLPGGRTVATLDADAATVNPYVGDDPVEALDPWLRAGRGVFVLVHTSNPSAGRFQELVLEGGDTLAERVAESVAAWARRWPGRSGYAAVGAVVGATYPRAVAQLRQRMRGVWMLLPGVGAQGGTVRELQPAFDGRGLGAVVAVSRHILGAWQRYPAQDWRTACREAARELQQALEQVRRA